MAIISHTREWEALTGQTGRPWAAPITTPLGEKAPLLSRSPAASTPGNQGSGSRWTTSSARASQPAPGRRVARYGVTFTLTSPMRRPAPWCSAPALTMHTEQRRRPERAPGLAAGMHLPGLGLPVLDQDAVDGRLLGRERVERGHVARRRGCRPPASADGRVAADPAWHLGLDLTGVGESRRLILRAAGAPVEARTTLRPRWRAKVRVPSAASLAHR
jgi:hypothetical protein